MVVVVVVTTVLFVAVGRVDEGKNTRVPWVADGVSVFGTYFFCSHEQEERNVHTHTSAPLASLLVCFHV